MLKNISLSFIELYRFLIWVVLHFNGVLGKDKSIMKSLKNKWIDTSIAKVSCDEIIRANDGQYTGRAFKC